MRWAGSTDLLFTTLTTKVCFCEAQATILQVLRQESDPQRIVHLPRVRPGNESAWKWHLLLTFVSATMGIGVTMFPRCCCWVWEPQSRIGGMHDNIPAMYPQVDTKSGNPTPHQDFSSS
eukprot:scaffold5864_cov93-Skeletonema_dohrnii-CCMP3373.AAC.10